MGVDSSLSAELPQLITFYTRILYADGLHAASYEPTSEYRRAGQVADLSPRAIPEGNTPMPLRASRAGPALE